MNVESVSKLNFALIGAAGYIAPRHLKAIHDLGHALVAACDPSDSVGVLDRYSHDTQFFTEFERFDRHVEKLRRGAEASRVHYVSVCSPNYLHDAHCRFGVRVGADVICEKPLVIKPWNLEPLEELEAETGRRIFTVLQLRILPQLLALKEKLAAEPSGTVHEVSLRYVTARGSWYHQSWKGSPERSGGIMVNIGIHLFDLLLWLFGAVEDATVIEHTSRVARGTLRLERAKVDWFLSIDAADVPPELRAENRHTFRAIRIDGDELEFSEGFADLHTEVYRRIIAGTGAGIAEARPAIQLVHRLSSL